MAIGGVEFADVSFTLPGGRALLRGISLCCEAGTTTALLGRSGSGKTTLLRTVNHLLQPTGGEVRVNGERVGSGDLQTLRRHIGYVIQETGLFPHMTVERNIGMALELAGVRLPERRDRAAAALGRVGLAADLLPRRPWQLSGGQRQRVGVARALIAEPKVLLMDEPFGALDPLSRAEMQSMCRDLLRGTGVTALVVTHDLPEALFLAQRVVLLEEGRVVADAPAAEVLHSGEPALEAYVRAAQPRAEVG